MGKATSRVRTTAARARGKKAATEARMALTDGAMAARHLARAGWDQIQDAGLDERAVALAERLRAPQGVEALERLRESEAAGRAQERGRDLTRRTRELAQRLQASDTAAQAREAARRAGDEAMERLGAVLTAAPVADRLGIRPARRGTAWLPVALAIVGGFVAGMLLGRRQGEQEGMQRASGWAAPETLAPPLGQGQVDLAPPTGVERAVRERLASDPRTRGLDALSVSVADATAFVRGVVPPEADEFAIAEVVRGVDGVDDVDLQVTVTA